MRVVVLDHSAVTGGAELALLRLVPALAGRPVEVRMLVFAEGPFARRLRAEGIPTAVLPLDSAAREAGRAGVRGLGALRAAAASARYVPRLARALRGSRAELVVANSLKAAVLAAVAAPLAGRRWVWHLHDRLADDYLPRPTVALMRALAAWCPRAIVVNSAATLATLPPRARRRATIAYPGLAAEAYALRDAPAGAPIVGMIGRLSPTKGQREFVAAAARVAPRWPEVDFRIAGAALYGEDCYEAEVRAMPPALGIADRVTFTGWTDDPRAELDRLTVLVHASPVPEPFGQVVAEALAAGVAVVAADAGGVPEILEQDRAYAAGPAGPAGAAQAGTADGARWRDTGLGRLVRPGDPVALAAAIDAALADAGDEERRERGRRRAERFSIAATADAVWRAWRGAAGRVG